MDKKEILSKKLIPLRKNKDILLINNLNKKCSPQNKLRILINKNNNSKISPNKLIIGKNNKSVKDVYTKKENNNKKVNKSFFLKKDNYLDEITLNCLAQENNLLKKEIEIVKSNLLLSDEKEQLHIKTIQRIKEINKEKEKTYQNNINLINEYKKRELEFRNKIKEIEINFSKKVEELNNELSIFKNELFNKNKIINDLNKKINNLNEQILNLKKIISEKNNTIYNLSSGNQNLKKNNNNLKEHTIGLTTSKSCNNIISRKIFFKIGKPEKNIHKKKNTNYNTFKNIEKINMSDNIIIDNNNNLSDIDNINEEKRINSYYKKIIPKKHNNPNSLKVHSLKKNHSNNNIEINYNSLNYSINKNPNIIFQKNINNYKNKNIILCKKSLNKDLIKTERSLNNGIKEKYINNIKITPLSKKSKKLRTNNIIEFNNYSFYLNDIEKSQPNKLINIHEEFLKNKKNNNNGYISNNNNFSQINNKKLYYENQKGLYSNKNNLLEKNKNGFNINPGFDYNLLLDNISPLSCREIPK